jgi:DNA polymerase elongation subunit (family B)
LRKAAEALQIKYAYLLGTDGGEQEETPPLLQLTLLCADVFDVPIQSSMIPLAEYELAVVDLLSKLDEVLFSKKCLNLSEGLTFSIAVVDAPSQDSNHSVAPPILGNGGESLSSCWLPSGRWEEEGEEQGGEEEEGNEDDDDDGLFNRDIDLALDEGEEHNEARYWLDEEGGAGAFFSDDDDDDDDEGVGRCYYVVDGAEESAGGGSQSDDDDDDDDDDDACNEGRKRKKQAKLLPSKKKKGQFLTKVLVEPDSSILSLTWSDEGSPSEEWVRGEKGLFPLPSFRDDPELNNCCLLVAVVAGMALAQELKDARSWSEVYHFPRTEAWKKILPWKTKRTMKAAQELGFMTKRFARLHHLDLNVFKSGNVVEAGHKASGLLNVPVNFHLYHRTGAEQRFFTHPAKYEPRWPTVHILVLPSDGLTQKGGGDVYDHLEECREKSLPLKWHAAALIVNPSAYLHKSNGRSCCWCGRAYKRANFASHRCPLPPPRRRCNVCKRPQLLNRDFMSLVEKKDRCDSFLKSSEEQRREWDARAAAGGDEEEKARAKEGKGDRGNNSPPAANEGDKSTPVTATGKRGSKICPRCKARAQTEECAAFHLKNCKRDGYFRCATCGERAREKPPHVCDHLYCFQCKEHYKPSADRRTHKCYISKANPPKFTDHIAVWDTETTCGDDGKDTHTVNAVGLAFEKLGERGEWSEIYFYADSLCHERDGVLEESSFQMNYLPPNCPAARPLTAKRPRGREKISQYTRARKICPLREREEGGDVGERRDFSALDKFLSFILRPEFANYSFIAHYGQAFDCILLLNRLLCRDIKCEPIFEGNKAVLVRLPQFGIRFIDSHRYIKSPLEKFPSRFPAINEILPPSEAAKGVFPYRFNKPANYFYRGPPPPVEEFVDEFASEGKKKKARQFLESWEEGKVYDFQRELHKYLQADVKVLMAGVSCLLQEFYKFQSELQEGDEEEEKKFFHCFASPFLTLPQFLHSLWRTFGLHHKLFLLADQTLARKDSVGELEWLAYEQAKLGADRVIQTARSDARGQKRMGPFLLDGYLERDEAGGEGEKAWEFLGCATHCHWLLKNSCPLTRGMRPTDKNPFGEAPWQVLQRFRRKQQFLRAEGISLIFVWECTWQEAKKMDPRIDHFLTQWREEECLPPRRLAAREGLRGGRCETFRLLFDLQAHPERKMFYIDKNSLYPTVAVGEEYPVGESETLMGEELRHRLSIDGRGVIDREDGVCCLGLLQATLEAPDSLFLPILPVMSDQKLMFGLCSTCVKTRKPKLCTHRGRQRYLTDVWTIPEVVFALQNGYKLIRAHEALIYKEKAPIFKAFYAGLARMKLESEPLPSNFGDLSLQDYVDKLNSEMPWIKLQAENMVPNSGRRQFAKLCQNSGLGKLSQGDAKRQTAYVRHWKELMDLRNDPRLNIIRINPIHDSLAEVVYEKKASLLGLHRNTQVVVYSHVTAYARIMMMRDMQDLMKKGYRLFYTDTDSIVFDLPRNEAALFEAETRLDSPSYGFYKKETQGDIVSFCSLGCKNYSIITDVGERIIKVRGFSLSGDQTRQLLTPEKMKAMTESFLKKEQMEEVAHQFSMKVDRHACTVTNRVLEKKYSNHTFDKRFILDYDLESNPFAETIAFGARHTRYRDIPRGE